MPEWDEFPRLRTLLTSADTFAVEASDLAHFAPINILVGAIHRAFQPGSKLDEIVVLIGGQGIGKSAFLRRLLPYSEWFSDSLDVSAPVQQQRESLAGHVIVEIAELAGMTRADQEKLKAFLSRTNDKGRKAYARYETDSPRMCVIAGTTNVENCLPNDPSGNRRFIPIVCNKGSRRGVYGAEQRAVMG